jgi:hypothetical protein
MHPYHPPLFAAKGSVFMLQQMRKVAKSKVSSVFLGLLALSFGVWGIADIFRESLRGDYPGSYQRWS